MMDAIMTVQGWILTFLYSIVSNYGVAIILFTLVVKLLLFPLDIKQKRSMAKTQKIQPLLNEVQRKYGNDKERLNQETMKLYQKYGISPMSGCLPMLIQLPIIFALFYVVRKPLIYMAGVDFEDTWRIATAYNDWLSTLDPNGPTMLSLPAALRNPLTYGSDAANNSFGTYEIELAQVLAQHPEILRSHWAVIERWGTEGLTVINFNFLGMNLSEAPSFGSMLGLVTGNIPKANTMLLWIIPAASGASAYLSQRINGVNQPKVDKNVILAENEKPQQNGAAGGALSSMTKIMPIFSVVFAFTLPAGVGLYWTASNLIQVAQTVIVKKYIKTDISLEEIEGERKNAKNRKNRKNAR